MVKKIIVFIILLVALIIGIRFLVNDHKYYTACEIHEGNVKQWESMLPNRYAYQMGLNDEEEPTFKDPDRALRHAREDFEYAIDSIKEEYKLSTLTKYNCREYKKYVEKFVPKDSTKTEQFNMLYTFLDIFENSYLYYSLNKD